MNIEAALPEVGARLMAEDAGLRQDLARIDQLWTEALAASGGPYLWGLQRRRCLFAPVVMRVTRYGLPLSAAAAYCRCHRGPPGGGGLGGDALLERDFIPEDEPYRRRGREKAGLRPA